MKKIFFSGILILSLSILFLTGTVIFIAHNNKKLIREKETLILRNDSLHMEQLQTKKELVFIQTRLDSVLKYKGKKYFTFK